MLQIGALFLALFAVTLQHAYAGDAFDPSQCGCKVSSDCPENANCIASNNGKANCGVCMCNIGYKRKGNQGCVGNSESDDKSVKDEAKDKQGSASSDDQDENKSKDDENEGGGSPEKTTASAQTTTGGSKPGNEPENSGNQAGNPGNQPSNPGNQPSNSGNQPGNSGNQPGNSGNQPGNSGNQPGNSGNQPGNSGNQPGNSGNQPGNSGNQPGNSGNQGPPPVPGPLKCSDYACRPQVDDNDDNDNPFTVRAMLFKENSNCKRKLSVPGRSCNMKGGGICYGYCLTVQPGNDYCICDPYRCDRQCAVDKPGSCEAASGQAPQRAVKKQGKRWVHKTNPDHGAILGRHFAANFEDCIKLCQWAANLCRAVNYGKLAGQSVCELIAVSLNNQTLSWTADAPEWQFCTVAQTEGKR